MSRLDRHVGVQARCFLCDHDFNRVFKTCGIEQQLNLVARKRGPDTY